ncbi:MAG: flagellar assembly protein FliW [Defluviitaleaceae bacterium]|nr:flagellar assembly protein FliW [Defluviitaleaceae bacterium]
MKIESVIFGELEINEDTIITFKGGIPGFSEEKYVIIEDEENKVFFWIQSIENPIVVLPLINARFFVEEYVPIINNPLFSETSEEDMAIYNIVKVTDNIEELTVNLKGPIVIDTKEKKGMQVVSDGDFSVKHQLFTGKSKKEAN